MNTKGDKPGAKFTYPRDPPISLRQDYQVWALLDLYIYKASSVPIRDQSYGFPTNKTGMTGNSDSNGPGMSTGRGSLRNVCIASWTLYDLTSQSEHFFCTEAPKEKRW
jgi:hypothetical protein